jgi:small-conductance mechanosensitive channel
MIVRGAMRLLALVLLGAWLAIAGGLADPAFAASPPPALAPAPGITPEQARQALDVLNDPAKRAEVVNTLEAVVKAEGAKPAAAATPPTPPSAPAAKPAPAATPPATAKVTLEPGSLGAAVLVGASGFLGRLSGDVIGAIHAVHGAPLLWGWLVVMATNPLAQALLREAIWRVAIAFAVGLVVETAVRWLLLQPVRNLESRSRKTDPARHDGEHDNGEARAESGGTEPRRPRRIASQTLLRRLPLALLRFVLDLLPFVAFGIAGHIVAATIVGGSEQTRLIVLAMVDAYVVSGAVVCIACMMLSPQNQRLRLVRMGDATALWTTNWIRRIVVVVVFGYAIAQVGQLLGMSDGAHSALLKLSSLIYHVFLAIMVLQKRRAVKHWIRAPAGASGVVARFRNALAPVWHWIALFFLFASWIVWAIEVRNGLAKIFHFFLTLVLVAIVARLVLIVLLGSLDRLLRVGPELAERYPGLDARLHAYHPLLQSMARVLVYVVGALALLEFWGVPALEWFFGSYLGKRLVAACGTMALTLVFALIVWEAANAGVQAHLGRLTRSQQMARSTRVRTLLPLLRTTLLVCLIVIAGLTILSQIGIDIGPLLAGAGIVGVAIGFGSQKLVQDLITGMFLLLENAMQVGDWVTVSGLSGTVEHLSVRTIRLRAADGSVHIIPFSAVTSVTNTNRGLGNAAVNVTISYAEDTDRVGQVLKDIAAEMRKEPDFASKMLSDLQLWGVDKIDGASATLTGQIVCTDAGRWPVQREFNRRVKMRFQELGITIFNPVQTYLIPPAQPAPARSALPGPREAAAE